MYVDATNLFIKAQSYSLNSLKNSIIYIFFSTGRSGKNKLLLI